MRIHVTTILTAILAAPFCGQTADGNGLPANESFEQLHHMIQPQDGESLWAEIDWHTNVWEAREQAAALGKPIFIWAGSGGGPAGVC